MVGRAVIEPLLHVIASDPFASAYPAARFSVHVPPFPPRRAGPVHPPIVRPRGIISVVGLTHCCIQMGCDPVKTPRTQLCAPPLTRVRFVAHPSMHPPPDATPLLPGLAGHPPAAEPNDCSLTARKSQGASTIDGRGERMPSLHVRVKLPLAKLYPEATSNVHCATWPSSPRVALQLPAALQCLV